MAGGTGGRGDVVLGGRHLVGIFVLLVVMMGVVFTLGYVLGRSRYEEQAPAVAVSGEIKGGASAAASGREEGPGQPAAAAAGTKGEVGTPAAPAGGWDFYNSGDSAKSAEPLEPKSEEPAPAATRTEVRPAAESIAAAPSKAAGPPKAAAAASAIPAANVRGSSALIPKGAITLQVAALLREADALALAQVLQEKKFPTIVTTPSSDKYYRVQVGPYADAKSAAAARKALEEQGFKPMVRR